MVNNRLIRAKMAYSGETVADIAAVCEISAVSVSHKLNGKNPWKFSEIVALAEHYGCKIDEFVEKCGEEA